MIKKNCLLFLFAYLVIGEVQAQQSVARRWNEAILQAVREDFARPPITARTLFHTSMAMYDAWAAYDSVAKPYLLGNTINGQMYPFAGIPAPADLAAAREEAISYAVYRVAFNRYLYSPNSITSLTRFINLMNTLGYDINNTSTDYSSGSPAALGNLIGQYVIEMGLNDGSNEANFYGTEQYSPLNAPLDITLPGNPFMLHPNNWQPLAIPGALDQNGNPIPAVQIFQSPEWGRVLPFALTPADRTDYYRGNFNYPVYHDPGMPPQLSTVSAMDSVSQLFKWGHAMVSVWGAHHDPNDSVLWDISPNRIGNVQVYPQSAADYPAFYKFEEGGDNGIGHAVNPKTGQPYAPQIVPRGDYTRVISQFWADGPHSETPPGHWYVILNYVNDQPGLIRRFAGEGPLLDTLEWDIKAYFALGGAVHDAAISAWGIKGWYDSARPISAIRYMTDIGQSTDPTRPFYHPGGIQLIPGYIEQIAEGDSLAGPNGENIGRIKLYTWKGHAGITDPLTQTAGVGWTLAENWMSYQRKTFVTPPFGGFISGHSTYSRAAAEILTMITGDPFFPGGLGEFPVSANTHYLVFENGPTVDITLQWATYRDASDQTSLSRIWGGIHPPFDDIPGRVIGEKCANAAFNLAKSYFYRDADQDGFYSYEDCNDNDATTFPGAPELCDNVDNDCDGLVDDNSEKFPFFKDADNDGYGDPLVQIDSCAFTVPLGYAANPFDCDDTDAAIFPGALEICDSKDNNCDGSIDENLLLLVYFADADNDGFGDFNAMFATCSSTSPAGYTENSSDCDDNNPAIYPGAIEVCDGLDNNCDGIADEQLPLLTYFADADNDGFGDALASIDTCAVTAPAGYVTAASDCNDTNSAVYPGALEVVDGFDNDCNGIIDDVSSVKGLGLAFIKIYPNPVNHILRIAHVNQEAIGVDIWNATGQWVYSAFPTNLNGVSHIDFSAFPVGIYLLRVTDAVSGATTSLKLIKQ